MNSKKYNNIFIIICLGIFLGIAGQLFCTQNTLAAGVGNLIKLPSDNNVYYLGDDYKRHWIPNISGYEAYRNAVMGSWGWADSNIITVSQSELESYPLSENVFIKANTYHLKIETGVEIYNVEYNNVLKQIDSTVNHPYGWDDFVIIPDVIFVTYQIVNDDSNCQVTLDGLIYKLSPCEIKTSMIDGDGGKTVTFKIDQVSAARNYSFEVNGYGVGFPTYGIMTTPFSGGATGDMDFAATFKDDVLDANGDQTKKYTGYLPIKIYHGSSGTGVEKTLKLMIELDVLPKKTSTDTNCQITLDNTVYKLSPCEIKTSMVDGAGDKEFSFKIDQISETRSYGFGVYGYGEGFPTYGIITTPSSGGASGDVSFKAVLKDQYLNSESNQTKKYTGYLPIKVYYGSAGTGVEKTLKLMVDVDVSPASVCTDSDGGKNYYQKGTGTGWNTDIEKVDFFDTCYKDYWANLVDSCSGDKCFLAEKYCEGKYVKTELNIKCPNGCKDGACVTVTNNKPDLIIESAEFIPNNPEQNKPFTGNVKVIVKNQGNVATNYNEGVKVSMSLRKANTALVNVGTNSNSSFQYKNNLQVGESVTVLFPINDVTIDSPSVAITAYVDNADSGWGGFIDESNENNNSLTKTINIKEDNFLGLELDKVALNSREILMGFKLTHLDYNTSDPDVMNNKAAQPKEYIQQTYQSKNYVNDRQYITTGLRLYNQVSEAEYNFDYTNTMHSREVINLSESEKFGDEIFCHRSPDFTTLNKKTGYADVYYYICGFRYKNIYIDLQSTLNTNDYRTPLAQLKEYYNNIIDYDANRIPPVPGLDTGEKSDLTIKDVYFSPATPNKSKVYNGELHVKIANIGKGVAESDTGIRLAVVLAGPDWVLLNWNTNGTKYLPDLPANTTQDVVFPVKYAKFDVDYLNVRVWIDSNAIGKGDKLENDDLFINESNEDNNTLFKKIILGSATSTPTLTPAPTLSPTSSPPGKGKLAKRLSGRLLLAVEDKGRIHYVNPDDLKRYEVTFGNVMSLFQNLALGINNADLNQILINPSSVSEDKDTGRDGFNNKIKVNTKLSNRLIGKLLLQVEDRGRIWYVDQSAKRWEVTFGNVINLFTSLALGITDQDLSAITAGD